MRQKRLPLQKWQYVITFSGVIVAALAFLTIGSGIWTGVLIDLGEEGVRKSEISNPQISENYKSVIVSGDNNDVGSVVID